MKYPVTGYVVFVHNMDIGAHAPQFSSMDEAEDFAKGLRATTDLTVSEPIPVVATETKKSKLMEVKYGL